MQDGDRSADTGKWSSSVVTSTGTKAEPEPNLVFQFDMRFASRSYRRAICATLMPGWFASATTRFLNVSLQRRREVLGLDAMGFLPAQIQADIVGMFECDCKAVSGVRLLFMRDENEFSTALTGLIDAINTDIAWTREHSRLTELAEHWEGSGHEEGLLLSHVNLAALGKLLEDRPRTAPDPTGSLLEFRDASRAKLEADRDRERRIIGRGFVKPSEQALGEGKIDHALRLAAAGAVLAQDIHFEPSIDTRLSAPALTAIFRNKILVLLQGHESAVHSAEFSPDGGRIVTASDDTTARIWDTESGAEIARLQGHEGYVNTAAFSPDGQRIVTASDDTTARIWDTESGAEIARLQGHESAVHSAQFSPDGGRIVSASFDDTMARVWDATSGTEIAILQGHEAAVQSALFSPDGQRIVTASSDTTARIWDTESGAEIARLQGHEATVQSAQFSPDGQRIVTASSDTTARIWDTESGAEIACLQHHEERAASGWSASMWFSPTARRIVTASDHPDVNLALVWDAESGAEVTRLQGVESTMYAAFSPDGRRIVAASADDTASVWDVESGAEIARLQGHEGYVNAAAFSPDGRRIVTVSDDATARVWDIVRTEIISQPAGIVLAAGLMGGVGRITKQEAQDILMQDAPEDLYAAVVAQFNSADETEEAVKRVAAALRAPRGSHFSLGTLRSEEPDGAKSNEATIMAPENQDAENSPSTISQAQKSHSDMPLLDLSKGEVKCMLKNAKDKGYVTYDDLNDILPTDEVTFEQVEDMMSRLSDMGINVVETEESKAPKSSVIRSSRTDRSRFHNGEVVENRAEVEPLASKELGATTKRRGLAFTFVLVLTLISLAVATAVWQGVLDISQLNSWIQNTLRF
jgi:WD40 repeat protein